MNIQYRSASIDDLNDVIEIFLKCMDLSAHTKATSESTLRNIATIALAKDFHDANFIKIAACNDKVCGVLIGSVNTISEPALSFDQDPIIKNAKEDLSKSDEGQMVLTEMQWDDEKEESVSKNKITSDCDSKLVYFAVNEQYRRFKIGSTLIKNFEEYLKECEAKKYLLHTDNKCTYQYYDNNGYERVEEKKSTFNPLVVNYIYVKELDDVPVLS